MYWIVTDSGIDMPKTWIDQQPMFRMLNLSYLMDDVSYVSDGTDESIKAFYDAMRSGKSASVRCSTRGKMCWPLHSPAV